MTWSRLKAAFLIAVIPTMIVISIAANRNSAQSLMRSKMNTLPERLIPLFEQTKVICAGRFLVDVPSTATVVYGPSQIMSPIYRYSDQADKIGIMVQERLSKIEGERYLLYDEMAAPTSMFGKVVDGATRGQKFVFGRADDVSYKLESYLAVGKDLFVQEAYPLTEPAEYTEKMRKLNLVASHLRSRSDENIPNEPGFCIDGGFVTELAEPLMERISVGVRLKEFPDVHFSFSMIVKDRLNESDALAARLDKAEKEAKQSGQGEWYSRIKIFRKGERQLGGWTGYEALARKPRQATERESHEFVFLSPGEPKNRLLPYLDIKLETGVSDNRSGAIAPSLTDDEALAIWDRLTNSIRIRPVGLPKPSINDAPVTKLGGFASAGDACPQDGWWQCADGGAGITVSGGQRQYFRVGERMPQAKLLARQSLWQKVRSDQPSFESGIPTVWKLVDYRKKPRTVTVVDLVKAAPAVPALTDSPAPAMTRDSAGASISSGATIDSGAACPASGWWTCQNQTALDGTRWFALGDIMPLATVRNSPTLTNKLKGAAELLQVPSSWQFVRHAEQSPAVDNHNVSDTSKGGTDMSSNEGDTPSEGA